MCGFAGYIGHNRPHEASIRQTLRMMKNRGPDCQRYCVFENGNVTTLLLHSRLGIIDLDQRSNQPFTIGPVTIVFNGEIYNYIELRNDLKKLGVRFKTESDTEVLLRSYMMYGAECVQRFEGMWSFAIHDAREGTLFLSRDRFAEKPLYYLKTPNGVFFGSEIKYIATLLGRPLSANIEYLLGYLVKGYKWLRKSDDTFYKNVKSVPYATHVKIGNDLSLRRERYWRPRYAPRRMSLEEAVEGCRHHLMESIKIRLRSDVPIAFCLSGGVDSSALTSFAAKSFGCSVTTFSIIDPDERYNELENIKATIDDLQCDHRLINLVTQNSLERLQQLIHYHDSPLATITYFVHSFLTEAIKKEGYRVAFSGTGADELFTGYYDHYNLHLYETRNLPDFVKFKAAFESQVLKSVRNPDLRNPELYFRNPFYRDHIFDHAHVHRTYLKEPIDIHFEEASFTDSLLRNRMLNELFHEAIPVILNEEDLNSMMHSIENRSPYLDSRLCRFMYTVPPEHLIIDGYAKYLLREAVDGVLNEKVRLDRQKKGFNCSISSVFDFKDPELYDWILMDGPIYELVCKDRIKSLIDSKELIDTHSKFLFNLINAKIFLEMGGRN